MEAWSVHQLARDAEATLGTDAARDLKSYAQKLIRSELPVIFTLKHLSKIVGVDFEFLRTTVDRRRESANYRMFAIKKRSGGRRFIHAVSGQLIKTQQFINTELLQRLKPHPSSFAFHAGGGIRKCASMHCDARWLFQYDINNFFYDINEADVYSVFKRAGYRSLLAFELSRLCTTTRLPKHLKGYTKPRCRFSKSYAFYDRHECGIGVLPQGAPTSPMLSNLVSFELDENLTDYAEQNGLVYTRYADDLTFSASGDLPEDISVGQINRSIIGIIRKCGFKENERKTRIAGPGAKKVVLGLLVDGKVPRISKETYKRIDRHLHASLKYGLEDVAAHEKFDTSIGFYNHLAGLIAFVKDVDQSRWTQFQERLMKIPSPVDVESLRRG